MKSRTALKRLQKNACSISCFRRRRPLHRELRKRKPRRSASRTSARERNFARSFVNRVWAHYMGRGLVEPVDDMEQPSWNPDLLDYLAEDLVGRLA